MAEKDKVKKSVLLVVDAQVGVVAEAWDRERIVGNMVVAVEKARASGVPVIWVQHMSEELVRGEADWELVAGLAVAEGERRIDKMFNSSFEETPLAGMLTELGVNHIVLAGAATNWCIRATAYGALERGYDVTLVKDGHTTDTIELENGLKIEAEQMIHDLNIAMKWLAYAQRVNDAVGVAELQF
ncbi:MAG TPA: isochorismatase family cysteine hydrolase [Anaerolineae bacterium]|nr:isochorismatase family cysteine hydrolase [Anaerolineae bacterium]